MVEFSGGRVSNAQERGDGSSQAQGNGDANLTASRLQSDSIPQLAFSHRSAAGEVLAGEMDELKNHKGALLADALAGAGAAVMLSSVGREVRTIAGLAGAAVSSYELATHAPTWMHAASVFNNPSQYDAAEQKQAHATMFNLGRGLADFQAGTLGAVAGGVGVLNFSKPGAFAAESRPMMSAASDTSGSRSVADSLIGGTASGDAAGLSVSAPTTSSRLVEMGGRAFDLHQDPNDLTAFGHIPADRDALSTINVYFNTPGELQRAQASLIPFLSDSQAAGKGLAGWKTFDPAATAAKGVADSFEPQGRGAEGFTVYMNKSDDSLAVHNQIMSRLKAAGIET